MVLLGEHFRHDTSRRASEYERQKWFIKARDDRAREEKLLEKIDDEMDVLVSAAITATQEAVKAFEVKLDAYDQAAVTALMINQEQLDAVQARIDAMLDRAYVMEDGRRVFKSEDGSFVIDEHGQMVSADDLDPLAVPDSNPTAEAYLGEVKLKEELAEERSRILDYQEKLDDAREEIADGITEDRLKELDAELLEEMPTSVRTHVPGLKQPENAPNLKADFEPSAAQPTSQPTRIAGFDHNTPG